MADDDAVSGGLVLGCLNKLLQPTSLFLAVSVIGGQDSGIGGGVIVGQRFSTIQHHHFQVAPAVGIVVLAALVGEVGGEIVGCIPFRLVVSTEHIEVLTGGKEFDAAVDERGIGLFALGCRAGSFSHLHVLHHVTCIDYVVGCLIVECIEEFLQHLSAAQHVAHHEQMVFRSLGVEGGEFIPVGFVLSGQFCTVWLHLFNLLRADTVFIGCLVLQRTDAYPEVLYRERHGGCLKIVVDLVLPLYFLIILGDSGLSFLAQFHPRKGGNGILKHNGDSVVGEFLKIWAATETCGGCRQENWD